MRRRTLIIIMCMVVGLISTSNAQNPCGTDPAMKAHYSAHPEMKKAADKFDNFTRKYAQEKGNQKATQQYIIPVVFHIFGTVFNSGTTVNDAIVIDALQRTNEDFVGLGPDWNNTDSDFDAVKSIINVKFELAKLDPNGNPTTGIIYHDTEKGFGNTNKRTNSKIQSYAWDNYKYMNVYIMRDLYGNRDYYNSGVAWYPDSWMSDNNLARVVYNGSYLGNNTDENFRSVLTHEFGHWINLAHTFQGGCPDSGSCNTSGDYICDTPPADNSHMDGDLNCLGQKTNWQNFMDYSDMYAMYTIDQNTRSEAAMQHSARYPLWQEANLIATGIIPGGGGNAPVANFSANTTSILEGESVNFTDQSTNSPTSWSWSFPGGNPSSSSSQNPSITYNAAGTYNATLIVANNDGLDSLTRQNYITVTTSGGGQDILMQNGSASTCSGTFKDSGGDGNYSSNENSVLTISPDAANQSLVVQFNTFRLESKGKNCGADYLEIFDGTSTSAPLIGSYCGTNSPGTIQATSGTGALTFRFYSNSRKTASGWDASISCTGGGSGGEEFTPEISISPNPAEDVLNITAPNNSTATIYNANGAIVLNTTVNGNDEINISNLPSGMYLVKINDVIKKLMKK